jgi:hypothetical protein
MENPLTKAPAATINTAIPYQSSPTSRSTQIKDFLNSNNFIAKISFLFLIIFVVVVLFQLIMRYLVYLYSPPNTVKLLNGMVNANSMKVINQDVTQSPYMLVSHSSNEDGGIEFTWSVWFFISNLDNTVSSSGVFRNIFFKGNYNPYSGSSSECTGINIPNNGPGMYIMNDSNTSSASLQVLMDTFQQASSYMDGTSCKLSNPVIIPHIPLNTWVNAAIRCKGNILDVYVNGVIANSVTLVGVPKQNYGNVYVAANGGFSGNIASLIYMNHSASNKELWDIYQEGPNTRSIDPTLNSFAAPNYLSFNWYATN